jgi:hypothetical protein
MKLDFMEGAVSIDTSYFVEKINQDYPELNITLEEGYFLS